MLSERSIDHVVLERGEIANSWRRERWDSLRLLTPIWLCRLPDHRYDGPDPDGYMTMGEVIDFVERFATVSAAPVRTGTNVTSVRRTDDGYHVTTSRGEIRSRTVVIATRESRLALWQAEHVRALLMQGGDLAVTLLPMTTRGDQILDRSISKVGGKGLFVKELETALADRRADVAVHSLKDLPTILPEGLAITAITEREDPRDALVLRADAQELARRIARIAEADLAIKTSLGGGGDRGSRLQLEMLVCELSA